MTTKKEENKQFWNKYKNLNDKGGCYLKIKKLYFRFNYLNEIALTTNKSKTRYEALFVSNDLNDIFHTYMHVNRFIVAQNGELIESKNSIKEYGTKNIKQQLPLPPKEALDKIGPERAKIVQKIVGIINETEETSSLVSFCVLNLVRFWNLFKFFKFWQIL